MVKNKNNPHVNNKHKEAKLSPKERMITYLIENKASQSIRAISGASLVDYKNAYNLLNELQPEIISKEKIGNTTLVKLNLVPNPQIYSAENKRTEKFLFAYPALRAVKRYIEELNYPFFIVLLFGSYVKNDNTKSSDIDICIISDNKDKTKELLERLSLLSLNLEIHDFTTKEFISMIEKNKNNLGHEIVKSNVILYGIENYYHLIEKWMKKE